MKSLVKFLFRQRQQTDDVDIDRRKNETTQNENESYDAGDQSSSSSPSTSFQKDIESFQLTDSVKHPLMIPPRLSESKTSIDEVTPWVDDRLPLDSDDQTPPLYKTFAVQLVSHRISDSNNSISELRCSFDPEDFMAHMYYYSHGLQLFEENQEQKEFYQSHSSSESEFQSQHADLVLRTATLANASDISPLYCSNFHHKNRELVNKEQIVSHDYFNWEHCILAKEKEMSFVSVTSVV